MPDPLTLLAFLGASLILTVAPGPDNLMVLAHSLARGWRAGLGFALGCTLGCMTHILWATLGVSAALLASPVVFSALKWAGAAYLVWMAVSTWRSTAAAPTALPPGRLPAGLRSIARGFLANAINPKVALFFMAFMPQFLRPQAGPAALQMLVLGTLFMLQTLAVFGAIALAAGHVGRWMKAHPAAAPWLDRVASAVFVALAAHLAVSGLAP